MADLFKGRRLRKAVKKATARKPLRKKIQARTAKRGIGLSKLKAKKVLREVKPTLRGKPITKAQRGLLGLVAGGGAPTRLAKRASQLSALVRKKALKRKKK